MLTVQTIVLTKFEDVCRKYIYIYIYICRLVSLEIKKKSQKNKRFNVYIPLDGMRSRVFFRFSELIIFHRLMCVCVDVMQSYIV